MQTRPKRFSSFVTLRGTENICVHAPLHLGDSVMSIPFVQTLRTHFPRTRITLVVKSELAALWRGQPYADKIRSCASTPEALSKLSPWLKKQRFDLSFLLATGEDVARAHFQADVPLRIGHDFWRRAPFLTHFISTNGYPTDPNLVRRHKVQNYLDLLEIFSIKPLLSHPRIFLQRKKKEKMMEMLRVFGLNPDQKVLGIAPGTAAGPSTRWPAESFRRLTVRLAKTRSHKIVLLGSMGDWLLSGSSFDRFNTKRIINQMGRTNLDELIGWILRCELVVANDSGISHLSNALCVPTVTLFGSSSPVWTGPLDPRSEVITLSLPCSPCFQPVCPLKHTHCLKNISAEHVFGVVQRTLSKEKRNHAIHQR